MWTEIASLVMIIRMVMDIDDDYDEKPCVAGVERIRLSKTLSAAGSRKSQTNLELVKLIKLRTGTKLVKYSDAVIYNVSYYMRQTPWKTANISTAASTLKLIV